MRSRKPGVTRVRAAVVALGIVFGGACRASGPDESRDDRAAEPFARGSTVLKSYPDDDMLSEWSVVHVMGDTVEVEALGTHTELFPKAELIPMVDLELADRAELGDVVVSRVTDIHWELGLMQGRALGQAYVRQLEHAKHYDRAKVFRVPDAYLERFADTVAALQLRESVGNRVPHRPPRWFPDVGDKVLLRGDGYEPATVTAVRYPVVEVYPSYGSYDWRPLGAMAPASGRRSPAVGDIVARVGDLDFGRVTEVRDGKASGVFQSGPANEVDADELVVLVPPATLELDPLQPDALDLRQRSLLFHQALNQLGMFASAPAPGRDGVLLFFDRTGQVIAEARYGMVVAAPHEGSGYRMGWNAPERELAVVARPTDWEDREEGFTQSQALDRGLIVGEAVEADFLYSAKRDKLLLWDFEASPSASSQFDQLDAHARALLGIATG